MPQHWHFFSTRNLLTLTFIFELLTDGVERLAGVVQGSLVFAADVVEVLHLLH